MNFKIMALCLVSTILSGCDNAGSNSNVSSTKNNDPELANFIEKIKSELVFVEGGNFKMGDFGVKYSQEHMPLDGNKDSKPLHNVQLSSYSISKYKTRNQDYQFYLKHEDVSLRKFEGELEGPTWDALNKDKNNPAHADWYEADKYCSWLSKVTHLPFSLATEAQWEYAARSRGQYFVVPTDDGTWKIKDGKGINVATSKDRYEAARINRSELGISYPMPVDGYPPNPLGVYDMTGNGFEWVKDWYSENYYKNSPEKNPQGPAKADIVNDSGEYYKVLRGNRSSNAGEGITISRGQSSPDLNGNMPRSTTIRCVVNSPKPVK